MISKARIKFVHTLEQKKARTREQLFVAEGPKVVGDLMARFQPKMLFHTADWHAPQGRTAGVETDENVSEEELKKLSFLQHPQQVLAVFPYPTQKLLILSCQVNSSVLPSMGCRIPAMWEQSSGWPTGLASHSSTVPMRLLMFTIPRWYKLRWAAWQEWTFTTLI